MDRRDLLKPSRFGNVEKRRLLDIKNLKEKRSNRRTTNFNLHRHIDDIAQEVKENNITKNVNLKKDPVLDRKLALHKFKAEKEAQKKLLKEKKKPPFVVGIPHHGSSPLLKNPSTENNSKRETKVTAAQKFSFNPHKIYMSAKKLTSPHTPTVLKRSAQKIPLKNVSNLALKLKKSPKNSYSDEPDEVLAAPLPISEDNGSKMQEKPGVGGTQVTEKRHKTPENVSSQLTDIDVLKVEKIEDEVISEKCDDIELTTKVEFQQSRLQSETTRLQEMADRWEAMVLHESLPQEVVDEVDSVVGQTRLLTGDKFQQFRRLIIQFENKTGTHPITWDDLNGFWDMVYLQVESLDKKYKALDGLKNNNWVNPEPVSKKKRRPVKKLKDSQVTELKLTSAGKPKRQNLLQLPEDSIEVKTPTTDMKQVGSNVLLKIKRTRSNSSSPYITMRLSGVGRASNIVGQPLDIDGSPRSIFANSAEPPGTPKSALKKSLTALSASTKKRTTLLSTMTSFEEKIEETDEKNNHLTDSTKGSASKHTRRCKKSFAFSPSENKQKSDTITVPATEDLLVPAFTPRRSMRLLTKLQPTPVRCIHCDSTSCDTSGCSTESILRSSSTKQGVSPAVELQNTEFASVTIPDINKPSTSGVRFSLRPSILTFTENNNFNDIPKKTKKRRQASVFTPIDTTTEIDAAEPRRSTRQSRKVTFFESGAEEKPSLKLPATPYKKFQSDS